jgi:hypothetical protein
VIPSALALGLRDIPSLGCPFIQFMEVDVG